MSKLFEPFRLGPVTLSNRVVMAPMTRSRATDAGEPDAQTALYYKQRASAGLIISEGISISVQSQGYLFVPGLYTEAQVEAWRPVCDTVHTAGGFERARAEAIIEDDLVDLVAFGIPYIANPDLVARMQNDWPLAERDPATVYGGAAAGYTTYPPYQGS